MSRARLLLLVTAAAVAATATPSARADGDPASDVLYGRDVYLPYAATVPPTLAARLEAALRGARRAGVPLKLALIADATDLGSVGSLFGKPAAYARFLSVEIQFVSPARLLVVMPQGLALARAGRTIADPRIHVAVPAGGAGLASAALEAIRRLVPARTRATVGPRLPPIRAPTNRTPVASLAPYASGQMPERTAVAIAVAGTLAFLVLATLVIYVPRRRRLRDGP